MNVGGDIHPSWPDVLIGLSSGTLSSAGAELAADQSGFRPEVRLWSVFFTWLKVFLEKNAVEPISIFIFIETLASSVPFASPYFRDELQKQNIPRPLFLPLLVTISNTLGYSGTTIFFHHRETCS